MARQKAAPTTEDSEEARAFLQTRVALFWKVLFWFMLSGFVLGLAGPMVDPGPDLVITLGQVGVAGGLWWSCRRGRRSIRFCRMVDGGGMLGSSIIGVFLGRYLLAGFVREHAVVTAEGALMADAYLAMIEMAPMAMFCAIRAALIPSQARWTLIITAMVAVPKIVLTSLVVPAADGGLAWRGHGSGAFPWLPGTRSGAHV